MTDDRIEQLERRIKTLEDEREIARVIAEYGPLVDAGDAVAAAALWTAQGSYDTGDWAMSSRAEVDAMLRSDAHHGLVERGCCHFFGPPAVTVSGDDAVALCQSMLLVRRDSGGYAVSRAGVHLLSLHREQGRWLIVSRTARQLDGTPAAWELISEAISAINGERRH